MMQSLEDIKSLIIAINSSYIHTNLAVRQLAELCNASWREYNINQHLGDVLKDIYSQKPDIIAFSCYIWNISFVLKIAQDIKKLLPKAKLIFGGPEVSFDAKAILESNIFVDAIICGEGEETLPKLFKFFQGEAILPDGVLLRIDGGFEGNDDYIVLKSMSELPAPFSNYEYDNTKIYYYESSRGCPYSCAYCLSGDSVPLREKPLNVVFADVERFVESGARLVKFTDRTFNANKARACEILKHIAKIKADICFHFEVALDLVDEEFLSICKYIPEGRLQLEAGVQSCNSEALKAVSRSMDITRVKYNAIKILELNNIHLHMDLIAGLPYEGLKSFADSFNQIYLLYPQHLQLGFLKLLKGSVLRRKAAAYGIIYREYAPYEVLCTEQISAEELFMLKGVDELLNRYYNTGRARFALDFLTKNNLFLPFEYFMSLYKYCNENGYLNRPVSAAGQFEILISHGKETIAKAHYQAFLQELKKDYLKTKIKGRMPQEFQK